jgi:hypothetical protein
MRATPDPRRRRRPGEGATLVSVQRLRQILVSRPRQAPDGHKQGGGQPTYISMINRRGYWLRLLPGSVSYDHITHPRSGPGPADAKHARLDIHSHINARVERPAQPGRANRLFDAVDAPPHKDLIYTNSWSGIHPTIVAHSVAAS